MVNIQYNIYFFNWILNNIHYSFFISISIIILLKMELAKHNLLTISLADTPLGENFTIIENHLNRLKTDFSALFQTSKILVEKINEMDPFDEIAIPQMTPEKVFTTNEPISNIEFQNSQSHLSIADEVGPLIKVTKKRNEQQGYSSNSRGNTESRQSQLSILKKDGGRLNGNSSAALLRDLCEKIEEMSKIKKIQDDKISILQMENEKVKRILGVKDTDKTKKRKQKKEKQNIQCPQQCDKNVKFDVQSEQSLPYNESENGDGDLMSSIIKQFKQLKQYSRSKFMLMQKQLQTNFQRSNKIQEAIAQNYMNANTMSAKILKIQQNQQKQMQERAKLSKTPKGQERGLSSNSRKENSLNDTIESYKTHYEDKIVEIFDQMDRIRTQYFTLIENMKDQNNNDPDASIQMEKMKNLAMRIAAPNNNHLTEINEKMKKELSHLKKDHKKLKEQFNQLIGGINTGTNEKRTLIIKPNENKEDWKNLSQKIYKTRQQLIAMVKEIQTKIITNNDMSCLMQQIEMSLEECKILVNRKVNVEDYEKSLKRVQNRINSFIQYQCQKEGNVLEQDSMLVKQPWFCLSCDSEIKNFPKMNKTFHTEKPMPGKKVNPESHMVRRTDNNRLPSLH